MRESHQYGHLDECTDDERAHRGTGKTMLFSCFNDVVEEATSMRWAREAGNASETSIGKLWAASEIIADSCTENAKDIGSLIGTTFVARDMIRMVDALAEDGMMRYWGEKRRSVSAARCTVGLMIPGFSYGSALGQTVAAMFPDRMDKVVLDANTNPHQYCHWQYVFSPPSRWRHWLN
jgi:pimeloyl-ACP methyl ester carboxylesterase